MKHEMKIVVMSAVASMLLFGCCRYGAAVEQMKTNEHAAMEAAQGAGNE